MNVVFLLPVPGLYCIGWVKNEQDHMDNYIVGTNCFPVLKLTLQAFTYKLFLFQYEVLVLMMFVKLCRIARPDSIFNLSLPIIFGFALIILTFNILPTSIMLKLFNPTRDESETAILLHYPHYSFAARYPFLWVMVEDIMIIAFACILFMSLGLLLIAICILYVLIYYELQRQEMYMAKEIYKQNKEFIDGIMYHTRIISAVYCVLPLSVFCQFLIEEETDVSVPISIANVIFASSPIPAMLSFLWRNPACWSRRIRNTVNLTLEN
ncbi:Serpentine Receptor, class I [Caenorhabditis elegans]|uniref:Serpentine Receptor, class I n=1 Tax=Caenorhabditis elegans TaxID=6239 RepID=Q4A575_CAEEL|nr:Serpentine Receptor, class I [Caenorhabditis elegans]CCD66302.1 Serpentine Receptor, class I [Caenorhabditis elegans]|eukprot:NP_001033467.1 Uncharacterized protein CELE_C31B8.16 [Caenorhabditis elegans]